MSMQIFKGRLWRAIAYHWNRLKFAVGNYTARRPDGPPELGFDPRTRARRYLPGVLWAAAVFGALALIIAFTDKS